MARDRLIRSFVVVVDGQLLTFGDATARYIVDLLALEPNSKIWIAGVIDDLGTAAILDTVDAPIGADLPDVGVAFLSDRQLFMLAAIEEHASVFDDKSLCRNSG